MGEKPKMKKTNKKRGFTIIELVIVIAVIAILAGVLIPTFSSVIEKAQKSARLQTASQALVVALATQKDGALDDGTVFEVKDGGTSYYFTYTDGELSAETVSPPTTLPTKSIINAAATVAPTSSYNEYKFADMLKTVTVHISATDFAQIDGYTA